MNNQIPQQNANGVNNQQPQQQQPQQQRIVLQPLQIHSLTESYRNEMAKANELGNETEQGKEHLRQAKRIRLILLRFQQQQRLQRQQQQQQHQQQQQQQQQQPPNSQQQQQLQPQSQPQVQPQQLSQQLPQPQRQPSQTNTPIHTTPTAQQVAPVMNQQRQQPNLSREASMQGMQGIPLGAGQQQRPVNQTVSANQLQFQSRQGSQSSPAPGAQGAPQNPAQGQQHPNVSILQLQKIRKILDDFHARLKAIETTKRSGTLGPEELARLVQQEELLKLRYDQYTRAAVQMSQQIQLRRAQLAAAAASGNAPLQQQAQMRSGSQGVPGVGQGSPQAGQLNFQLLLQLQAATSRSGSQQPTNLTPAQQQQLLLARLQQQKQQLQQQQQQQQQAAVAASRQQSPALTAALVTNKAAPVQTGLAAQTQTRTPGSTGRSSSPPGQQSSTPVTRVNALARPSGAVHGRNSLGSATALSVVKSPVPTMPISASVNVPPPLPVTMKGARPTATGGGAFNSMVLTQPASYKLPQFEMEGDRVLHKRKLKELVRSVGSDEGDGETVVDGDVEELLLDLADEFVNNVTSFACRLAKHRKVDTIDVKDIQLHLEKNWNIRIPGYSSDEIRSTRRFQPTALYNQKLSGVDIAKSVKKDGN